MKKITLALLSMVLLGGLHASSGSGAASADSGTPNPTHLTLEQVMKRLFDPLESDTLFYPKHVQAVPETRPAPLAGLLQASHCTIKLIWGQ